MLLSEDNQKQTTGIEPALSAWEADVLPIYDVCEKLDYIVKRPRITTNFPAVIRFDYPLTDTQKCVCLSEDNLRTDDYLLSITRLFYPTKRFIDNQPTQYSDLWVLHKECLPTFNV